MDGNGDFQPSFIRHDLVRHPIDSQVLRKWMFQVPGICYNTNLHTIYISDF